MMAWRQVLVLAMAMGAATAQLRERQRGTFVDPDGRPIADATVVFAWAHEDPLVPLSDRVEVTTDDRGEFAADVRVGCPYLTWAIGPAAADRQRWTSNLGFAVAGQVRRVVAERRVGRHRLAVRGTAPWAEDGPLALRLWIHPGIAFGPDVPVPADGVVPLPPLPCDQVQVCLVDGAGGVVYAHSVDLATGAAVEFPAPTVVACEVRDATGKPVAGARLATEVPCTIARTPLPVAPTWPAFGVRQVAVTDERGRADLRLVVPSGSDHVLVFARAAGHATGFAPTLVSMPGEEVVADPLVISLPEQESGEPQVLGLGAADVVFARVAVVASYVQTSPMVAWLQEPASRVVDGAWTSVGTPWSTPRVLMASGHRDQAVPFRLLAADAAGRGEPAAVDVQENTVHELRVVDADGRPVAGALVALGYADPDAANLRILMAADGEGRAQVSLPAADWFVLAGDDRALGLAVLAKGAPAGTTTVQVRSMPTRRVRVRDRNGDPVVGAWVAVASPRQEPAPAADDLLGQVRQAILGEPAFARWQRRSRTGRDGEVDVRFPLAPCTLDVELRLGERVVAQSGLEPGGDRIDVTLPDAAVPK